MNQDLIGKTVYWVGVGYIARGVVKKTLNVVSSNDTLTVEHGDGYASTISALRIHVEPLDAAYLQEHAAIVAKWESMRKEASK